MPNPNGVIPFGVIQQTEQAILEHLKESSEQYLGEAMTRAIVDEFTIHSEFVAQRVAEQYGLPDTFYPLVQVETETGRIKARVVWGIGHA